MTGLAVPLSKSQVKAAIDLRGGLPRWVATDRALDALAKQFPDFGLESALLKVAALNQLYGTNVYAVTRMAEHVVRVMAAQAAMMTGPELVERLAALPKARDDAKERKHLSFASKFAHFFVDREQFPVYDSYTVAMLSYHLGWQRQVRDNGHPYRAYLANLAALRSHLDLSCTNRELDNYLWLAGQYRAWKRNPKVQINMEVRALFAAGPSKITSVLDALMVSELDKAFRGEL